MSSAFGFSKFLKAIVDDLSGNVVSEVARVEAAAAAETIRVDGAIAGLSTFVNDEVGRLEAAATAEQTRVNQALADEASARAGDVATLRAEAGAESLRLEGLISAQGADVSATVQDLSGYVRGWIQANTDEIAGEVDKAILERVNQTAFDAAVQQLESADSALTQSLADAVSARLAQDTTHTTDIERLMTAFDLLLSTYHLQDASGNVITTPRTL